MKNRKSLCLLIAICFVVSALIIAFPTDKVYAAELDEILDYTIHAHVNDDARVTLTYHIEWKVLDGTSQGPLEYVEIGIPNDHISDLEALTPTIKSIKFNNTNGHCVRVDFDRKYTTDEVVMFEFRFINDYMYDVDNPNQGETTYSFTPGWFDDVPIRKLTIKWDFDKVISHSPQCLLENRCYTWEKTSLKNGEKYMINVTYRNDAFAFDAAKSAAVNDANVSRSSFADNSELIKQLLRFALQFLVLPLCIFLFIRYRKKKRYEQTANFSSGASRSSVVREKIEFFPNCKSCGAPRPADKEKCEYCGASFIKSVETITEKDVPKAVKTNNSTGIFSLDSEPNTYIRIRPELRYTPDHKHTARPSRSLLRSIKKNMRSSGAISSSSNSSSRGISFGGSGSRSSSCACACACASGGRAGCSTKDFYNTGLKLKQLEVKAASDN